MMITVAPGSLLQISSKVHVRGSSQKTEALSATSQTTTASVFPSRTTTVPQRQLPGPSEALHLRGKRTRGPRLLQADATPQDPRHLEP